MRTPIEIARGAILLPRSHSSVCCWMHPTKPGSGALSPGFRRSVGEFDGLVPRRTSRSWTPEDLRMLQLLLEKGASAMRASVVLKRQILAVQAKARQLGTPFPHARKIRADRLAKER